MPRGLSHGRSVRSLDTGDLAEQFPDLFARAQPTVGDSGDNNLVLSLRNIPFLMWNSAVDELSNEISAASLRRCSQDSSSSSVSTVR